ncbi:MAG TPA: hypothetical protein VKV18_06250 [Chthonomonas sp.]|uniref:hypothetical protein n=1 Tax=Chthonomonas sp. TaxID=2282153 RepID=UPI002B4B88AC|nr:hypothetical protein [Chthonomonas sp.]HLI48278.1 hypothetical protein [Chthonomonas sp.]
MEEETVKERLRLLEERLARLESLIGLRAQLLSSQEMEGEAVGTVCTPLAPGIEAVTDREGTELRILAPDGSARLRFRAEAEKGRIEVLSEAGRVLVGLLSDSDGGQIEVYDNVGRKVMELQALSSGGGEFRILGVGESAGSITLAVENPLKYALSEQPSDAGLEAGRKPPDVGSVARISIYGCAGYGIDIVAEDKEAGIMRIKGFETTCNLRFIG